MYYEVEGRDWKKGCDHGTYPDLFSRTRSLLLTLLRTEYIPQPDIFLRFVLFHVCSDPWKSPLAASGDLLE